jgi:hypothetical protein
MSGTVGVPSMFICSMVPPTVPLILTLRLVAPAGQDVFPADRSDGFVVKGTV